MNELWTIRLIYSYLTGLRTQVFNYVSIFSPDFHAPLNIRRSTSSFSVSSEHIFCFLRFRVGDIMISMDNLTFTLRTRIHTRLPVVLECLLFNCNCHVAAVVCCDIIFGYMKRQKAQSSFNFMESFSEYSEDGLKDLSPSPLYVDFFKSILSGFSCYREGRREIKHKFRLPTRCSLLHFSRTGVTRNLVLVRLIVNAKVDNHLFLFSELDRLKYSIALDFILYAFWS
ncbi:unnamed protein product [Amoebophrya sp. A120]|nr:unnamed protein product [Amoebophrya sp. A120]|eukprot:GSA120T00012282001.1